MKLLITISLCLLFSPGVFSQGCLDGKFPKDMANKTLLVLKIEEAPKAKWLAYAQKMQQEAWDQYNYKFRFITGKELEKLDISTYRDRNEYPYIFLVKTGTLTQEDELGYSQSGMVYIYHFYDRKKDYDYQRIWNCYPSDHFAKKTVRKLNAYFKKRK